MRHLRKTRALALLALALLALPPLAAQRPNVVLIVADDQRWTDFGFMGHEVVETPNLDRLASESAVFARGYVPSSLCRPSLATMITGLYPHQHGITGNDPPRGVDRDEMLSHIDRLPTLPKLLAGPGYRSLQTGKWWEGHHRRGGFTDGMSHGDPERGGRHGDAGLRIGRKTMQPIFDFIEDCGETPFFVWYAPFLPHTPHDPPERILAKYRRPGRSPFVARYYAMCEWFDETCGELLDHLDRKGLAEETIVLFVTDNGWIQRPDGRGFAPRSKRSPYDGGVRTPIMVRWPGVVRPGRRDTPVSSIDIAPTVLKACGAEVPESLPGIDLVAACRGRPPAREAIFGATFAHDVVDIDEPARGLQYRWAVRGRWKLILPADPERRAELYDLGADPHEETDLAARHPDRVAELTAAIDAWWPAEDRGDRRPNVLLFLTDDQRADALGCAGHPVLRTPAIDALARDGVRFANAFVTTSICAASRASILTGLYRRTHGYTFGTPPIAAAHARRSYPRLLREAGYRTGFVGKLGVRVARGETERMFDVFRPLRRNPYFKKRPGGEPRHLTEVTADAAIAFLRGCRPGRPFCLSVSFNAPHAEDGDPRQYVWPRSVDGLYEDAEIPAPKTADPAFFETFPEFVKESLNRVRWRWRFDTPEKARRMTRGYYRMITGVDRAVGRVLRRLRRLGFADDTVVIFSSDNGYFLGERGFAGKWTIHEVSIRVPLIVRDPRRKSRDRNRVLGPMVLNVDVPPTILELAGVDVPESYQGRSLVPWLRGERPPWRRDFFYEHLFDHRAIPKCEGVRTERWSYVRYFEQDPPYEELYDLARDPHQEHNLAGDAGHAEVLARLRARTDELRERYAAARAR